VQGLPRGAQAKKLIVAIDGPSGAGKSTVAKRLAKELGYTYLDTGAMYRAFALLVWKLKVDPYDEKRVSEVLQRTQIDLVGEADSLRVLLNGRDVSEEIRTPEISQLASKVSSLGGVRKWMVNLQKQMGLWGGVVAEGRDIGTVVFPQAEVKIFLDASPQERAMRRFHELQGQGKQTTLEETQEEMTVRDRRDRGRDVAPLCKADDALVIDTTTHGIDRVAEMIFREVKKQMTIN
jgi:cytidylate kinase